MGLMTVYHCVGFHQLSLRSTIFIATTSRQLATCEILQEAAIRYQAAKPQEPIYYIPAVLSLIGMSSNSRFCRSDAVPIYLTLYRTGHEASHTGESLISRQLAFIFVPSRVAKPVASQSASQPAKPPTTSDNSI